MNGIPISEQFRFVRVTRNGVKIPDRGTMPYIFLSWDTIQRLQKVREGKFGTGQGAGQKEAS